MDAWKTSNKVVGGEMYGITITRGGATHAYAIHWYHIALLLAGMVALGLFLAWLIRKRA